MEASAFWKGLAWSFDFAARDLARSLDRWSEAQHAVIRATTVDAQRSIEIQVDAMLRIGRMGEAARSIVQANYADLEQRIMASMHEVGNLSPFDIMYGGGGGSWIAPPVTGRVHGFGRSPIEEAPRAFVRVDGIRGRR